MLDLLIQDATVYDGVSPSGRAAAVGILGDRIAWVGEPPHGCAARTVLSAPGRFLCPGFIDSHASTGMGFRLPDAADHKLLQGVTTEVVGNCGTSDAPIGPHLRDAASQRARQIGTHADWDSLRSWLEALEQHGLPINVGTHIGHSTLRKSAGAWEPALTAQQRHDMHAMLEEGLTNGALGMSTGLIYAPGCFASTAEIIDLARKVSHAGGLYVSHLRSERDQLAEAVEEALEIGMQAALPVLISHLKSAERPNWGRIPATLDRIAQAREAGQAVTVEVYPYTAVSTRLRAFFPPALLRGGDAQLTERLRQARPAAAAHLRARGTDFDGLVLITDSLPGARGHSIGALARQQQADPAQVAIAALEADPDAWVVYHCIDPSDMDAAILWPDAIVCSDSWSYPVNALNPIGDPHPRTFGAFTRFLEQYALTGRIPFGEAIRKITTLPARWLGLRGRGQIAVGAAADLVLLDPQRLRERATYAAPRQLSEGTDQVWVNGVPMLRPDGSIAAQLPGRVLRRRPR